MRARAAVGIGPTAVFPPEVAREAEAAALDIISKVVLDGPKAQEEVRAWCARIRADQAEGRPLPVMGHTALTYILRSGFFDDYPDPAIKPQVEASLAESWKALTGKVPEDLLTRLPRAVLRTASRESRAFHAAAFQSERPRDARRDAALGKDYVPEVKDAVMGLGLLAIAFTETGSAVLGGALLGAAVVTLAESFLHKNLAHPTPAQKKLYEKWPWLGRQILDAAYGHATVHHVKTFKSYVKQFESEDQKAKLDAELQKMGKVGERLMAENYGVSLDAAGVLRFLAPIAPVYVALMWTLGLGPAAIAGMLVPAALYPLASKVMHPYLHMPKEEAMQKAGPLARWLLGTRYVEMVSRLHYGHHKGRGGNFNITAPFGDMLLGELRKPNLKQLLRMRELQMIR